MMENRCLYCGAQEFVEHEGQPHCAFCGSPRVIHPEDQEVLLSSAYQTLRMMNFTDAERLFEDIANRYPALAEAYFGGVCATYGIRMEQDYSGKQIPTCCMPLTESFLDDPKYQKALSLAEKDTKDWYEHQAEYIERVRVEFLTCVAEKEPFDIFISYKDSDSEQGIERTEDSVEAQGLYTHLLKQGYRVFYSRETLRDVAGEKYEPHIFHALSTARVMIVYGKKAEYINSTWLRNEWQRFGKMMDEGQKAPGSLMVICDGFSPKELPSLLRSVQVLDGQSKSCYSDMDSRVRKLMESGFRPKTKAVTYVSRRTAQNETLTRFEAWRERWDSKRLRCIRPRAGTCAISLYREETMPDKRKNHRVTHLDIPAIAPTGERVTKISPKGFCKCDKLKRVIIPEGIETIGGGAFMGCSSLESLIIPRSVTSVGKDAFKGCDKLVTVEDGVRYLDGWVVGCDPSITKVTLRPDTMGIADGAFADCRHLPTLTLPEGIRYIGKGAFDGCASLPEIILPMSLVKADLTGTFRKCACLHTMVLPDGVTSLGDEAFAGCTKLTRITLSEHVTEIGRAAFKGCTALENITYYGTKAQWFNIKKSEKTWDAGTGKYTVTCTDGTVTKKS